MASNFDIEDQLLEWMGVSPEVPDQKSPGAFGSRQERITLESLRKEALKEFANEVSGKKSTRSVGVGDPPLKKQTMSMPDKIFKECYFRRI